MKTEKLPLLILPETKFFQNLEIMALAIIGITFIIWLILFGIFMHDEN